jgi:hypothetical protein
VLAAAYDVRAIPEGIGWMPIRPPDVSWKNYHLYQRRTAILTDVLFPFFQVAVLPEAT